MEFFYDGQIRRYVTQFMRIFIGFKYQAGDGSLTEVPVTYGDMTRQVAAIIRENSENKLPSVPKISCYITGLDLDKTRLADATYVSKVNIHERDYVHSYDEEYRGVREYKQSKGNAYTVERLMPTPFSLKMKADIWTSNTDQKLQLLEQILVLFNPSLEIQTTDNYLDWTSLSVVDLDSTSFTSRSIPAGVESDIDICSVDFTMPIYITPPAKVKRMGVVRDIVMNVFNADGNVSSLNELVYNNPTPNAGGPTAENSVLDPKIHTTPGGYGVLLLSANVPNEPDRFNVSVVNPAEAITSLGLQIPQKQGGRVDWNLILDQYSGKHIDGISLIHFTQPDGTEISGTFSINRVDPTYLDVQIDLDTTPSGGETAVTVDAIINPLTFNPRPDLNVLPATGTTYLLLDDIGGGVNTTFTATVATTLINTGVRYGDVNDGVGPKEFEVTINGVSVAATKVPSTDPDSQFRILLNDPMEIGDIVNYKVYVNSDGSDAWAEYQPGVAPSESTKVSELVAKANDIVKFDGNKWNVVFDSQNQSETSYMRNIKTGVQYRWDGSQWLRSFEGEYRSGSWRFTLS